MLTYIVGDIFQSPAHVLVNTVNTVGVMGKGIAKKFKAIYPEMFEQYRRLCESKKLTVGKVWLYKTPNKWILNFPTKTTWRKPSELEYIEAGLKAFVNGYAERGISSIAFPTLGCGNGELDWNKQVRPVMEKYLKRLPIDIFIYLYGKDGSLPEHKDIKKTAEWLRAEPETLAFSEVWMDLRSLISTGINLKSFDKELEFHVKCLEDDQGIQISLTNKDEYIFYDELLSFWNFFQSYGFGYPAILPAAVASYHNYLLALFEKLPYCREIILSRDYKSLNTKHARGIQYIPRPAVPYPMYHHEPAKHLVAV